MWKVEGRSPVVIWGDRDQPLRSISVALPDAPRALRVLGLSGRVVPTNNCVVWKELPGALGKSAASWGPRDLDLSHPWVTLLWVFPQIFCSPHLGRYRFLSLRHCWEDLMS